MDRHSANKALIATLRAAMYDFSDAGVRAALELDTVARARRVPAPIFAVTGLEQRDRFAPGLAVIGRAHHTRVAVAAAVVADVALVRALGLQDAEQDDVAACHIDDGRGVADTAGPEVGDTLKLAPRRAAVGRAFHHRVDVAGVASAIDAPLGKGEQVAVRSADDRGDAEGVVPIFAGAEDVDLLGLYLLCLVAGLYYRRGLGADTSRDAQE